MKILYAAYKTAARLPAIGKFQPLRGSFSALESLQSGKMEGKLIVDRQETGNCYAGSITEQAGFQQHDHQPWPIFWTRSNDARLVGKMLHWRDREDRICIEGAFYSTQRHRIREEPVLAQILLDPVQYLPGAWTSIVSNWGNGANYYHWILDSLTRLLVREQLPEETRILIPCSAPSFVAETIEMLGLSELALAAPGRCIQPERYYFCSPTAMSGAWNPLGYHWLRGRFTSFRVPSANGRPIFLTRRGTTRVPEKINEIESTFADHGFKIIDCSKYSVKEQICLASAAPAIAGLHGAAMTNILWAQSKTPILEIFLPGYLNACYEQIALHSDLAYQALTMNTDRIQRELIAWLTRIE